MRRDGLVVARTSIPSLHNCCIISLPALSDVLTDTQVKFPSMLTNLSYGPVIHGNWVLNYDFKFIHSRQDAFHSVRVTLTKKDV